MKKKTIRLVLILFSMIAISAVHLFLYIDSIKITIAIDPGHGGTKQSQKGYTSMSGIHECSINNAIAIILKKILIDRGYKVTFTKLPEDDIDLTLQMRPEAANHVNADLLISLHHDAGSSEQSHGFGIYYSSYRVHLDSKDLVVIYKGKRYQLIHERIAPDDDGGSYSIITIKDSNSTFEINSMNDQYNVIDESPCKQAFDSMKLAYIVYDKMLLLDYIDPKGMIKDTVADHEYRVLRYSKMPSILIECGFMTNSAELVEIQKSENQQKLALAIADAIDIYYK